MLVCARDTTFSGGNIRWDQVSHPADFAFMLFPVGVSGFAVAIAIVAQARPRVDRTVGHHQVSVRLEFVGEWDSVRQVNGEEHFAGRNRHHVPGIAVTILIHIGDYLRVFPNDIRAETFKHKSPLSIEDVDLAYLLTTKIEGEVQPTAIILERLGRAGCLVLLQILCLDVKDMDEAILDPN